MISRLVTGSHHEDLTAVIFQCVLFLSEENRFSLGLRRDPKKPGHVLNDFLIGLTGGLQDEGFDPLPLFPEAGDEEFRIAVPVDIGDVQSDILPAGTRGQDLNRLQDVVLGLIDQDFFPADHDQLVQAVLVDIRHLDAVDQHVELLTFPEQFAFLLFFEHFDKR